MKRRHYKPNDRQLKCPVCREEQIIEVLSGLPGEGTGTCRYCWFKSPLYVFRETYQNSQEHLPEFDPCFDENGYY